MASRGGGPEKDGDLPGRRRGSDPRPPLLIFHGSIPADMRSIVAEHVRAWDCEDVYVGCSGAFTVERVVNSLNRFNLHGNDVTLYSCAIGGLSAGRPVFFRLRERWQEQYGWLERYLDEPERALATLLLSDGLMAGLTARDYPHNQWFARQRRGHEQQWARMHAQMTDRIRERLLCLRSFGAADVVEWVKDVPNDQGVVCFPPFFAGDYTAMFALLDAVWEWPSPDFAEMDDDARLRLFEAARERRHWIFGTHTRLEPEWDPHLRGRVQTTNRGVPIWIYSSAGASRIATPHQPIEPLLIPRLTDRQEIEGPLGILELTGGQFAQLRSQYMNVNIKPGQPTVAYAVLAGGQVIGSYALSMAPTISQMDSYLPGPFIYLLSDFPVRPTRYRHLAKLVLTAALSQEGKLLAERSASRRCRSLTTTAFSQKPVSMKYRSLFRLLARRDSEDPLYRHQLNYGAELGRWTLAEGLETWLAKNA